MLVMLRLLFFVLLPHVCIAVAFGFIKILYPWSFTLLHKSFSSKYKKNCSSNPPIFSKILRRMINAVPGTVSTCFIVVLSQSRSINFWEIGLKGKYLLIKERAKIPSKGVSVVAPCKGYGVWV